MSTIFLTGGTGFLGSFLAITMLRAGHEIYFLARSTRGKSAERRIDEALSFVDSTYLSYKESYTVLEGDVVDGLCGLSKEHHAQLFSVGINEVWHVAGSISFSEKKRDETHRTNVDGTLNVLSLSTLISPSQIHFVSTAYVSGDTPGIFMEADLYKGQKFLNPYEETKYQAEGLVQSWADKHPHIRTLIFRPSIIVGDSRDGKICGYSGYYTYMRTYHVLRKILNNGNRNIVEWDGDKIVLPIEVPGIYDSPLNIVTIDYAVETMLKLADKCISGTYNITPDKPASYGFWLDEGTKYLGFKGIRVKNGSSASKNEFFNSIESQIIKGIADYIPYVSSQPLFDKSNVKKVLGAEYIEHPAVSSELIGTLLGYAVEHDFKE